MADLESCSNIEERSMIKFLVAEECKTSEIFKRMSVFMKKHVSAKKMSTNELNYSRKDKNIFLINTGQKDLQE